MTKEELLKQAVMISHTNTHSTSRILRNVELLKREMDNADGNKRLNAIEIACLECRKQVDDLYNLFKLDNTALFTTNAMKEFAIEVANYDSHSNPRKSIDTHLEDFLQWYKEENC